MTQPPRAICKQISPIATPGGRASARGEVRCFGEISFDQPYGSGLQPRCHMVQAPTPAVSADTARGRVSCDRPWGSTLLSRLLLPLLLLTLNLTLHAACTAIDGDRILAHDLVTADPSFTALNPDLYFSYAPAIGKQRTIPPAELSAWAAANGLHYTAHNSLCFERTAYTLTPEAVAAAIRQTLAPSSPSLKIDVLELCKCSLPPGKLSFPIAGVAAPPLGHPETPVLWRGQLLSKGGTPYPIWVRARVLATMTLVRAKQNLRSGDIIEAHQIEQVTVTESPLRFTEPQTAALYTGKQATRSLLEGAYLDAKAVRLPPDVARGEIVRVDVYDGGMHLQLDARAETTGNTGDKITLVNPSGLRHFQATISGPGHARINLSPPSDSTETTSENKPLTKPTTSERTL